MNVLTNKLKQNWRSYDTGIKARNPLGGNFVTKKGSKRKSVLPNSLASGRELTFVTNKRNNFSMKPYTNFSFATDVVAYSPVHDAYYSTADFASLYEDVEFPKEGSANRKNKLKTAQSRIREEGENIKRLKQRQILTKADQRELDRARRRKEGAKSKIRALADNYSTTDANVAPRNDRTMANIERRRSQNEARKEKLKSVAYELDAKAKDVVREKGTALVNRGKKALGLPEGGTPRLLAAATEKKEYTPKTPAALPAASSANPGEKRDMKGNKVQRTESPKQQPQQQKQSLPPAKDTSNMPGPSTPLSPTQAKSRTTEDVVREAMLEGGSSTSTSTPKTQEAPKVETATPKPSKKAPSSSPSSSPSPRSNSSSSSSGMSSSSSSTSEPRYRKGSMLKIGAAGTALAGLAAGGAYLYNRKRKEDEAKYEYAGYNAEFMRPAKRTIWEKIDNWDDRYHIMPALGVGAAGASLYTMSKNKDKDKNKEAQANYSFMG